MGRIVYTAPGRGASEGKRNKTVGGGMLGAKIGGGCSILLAAVAKTTGFDVATVDSEVPVSLMTFTGVSSVTRLRAKSAEAFPERGCG